MGCGRFRQRKCVEMSVNGAKLTKHRISKDSVKVLQKRNTVKGHYFYGVNNKNAQEKDTNLFHLLGTGRW